MNYYLAKALGEAHYEADDDSNLTDIDDSSQPSTFGCLKSCLLNLHVFTLQTWLVRNQTVGRLAMHGRMDGVDPDSLDMDAVLAKLNGLFADGGEVDLDGLVDGIESLLADLPTAADGDDADGAAPGKSDPWLSLGGLKTLSPGVASALAMHDGPLLLDGLTGLSPEVAAALATHSGELSLTGLTSLSGDAREALASHDGPVVLPDALVNASGGQ
jgi:hypothetical protein